VENALQRLRPGDVIMLSRGRHTSRAAVLTVATRKGQGVRIRAVTTDRTQLPLGAPDFGAPPHAVGHIDLPTPFTPNRQSYVREVARLLERVKLAPSAARVEEAERVEPGAGHPVTDDPDLAERLKAAAQADRVQREVDDLVGRVKGRSQSLARKFDRVLRVLEVWGYLDGWSLTDAGNRLARLFHESDLLVLECLRQGLLDDLDPAAFAGLASVFTYEHRSPEPPPAPWFPSQKVRRRWHRIEELARDLNAAEDDAGLPLTRMPDPTFAAVAYAWAAGEGFAEVVEDEELSGGDFVRNMKQLIDLLRQLADVAPSAATRAVASDAADRLFRGVVAASTLVPDERGEHPDDAGTGDAVVEPAEARRDAS